MGAYVVSGHDVTDRTRLEEELSFQAYHDSLTGLGNRALFVKRREDSLARAERSDSALAALFLRNTAGFRPFQGESDLQKNDPYFRDMILFYEYFHGDTGRGTGASHQTGWTGLVAKLLQPREVDATIEKKEP